MGRNTTTPNPSSLDRFAIGEIQDLTGVPNLYNAGTSTWAKSATFVDASSISTATKAILASAATISAPTAATLSNYNVSLLSRGMYSNYPVARISASGVSVVPALYANSTSTVGVGVMTSAGIQSMLTGQTSNASSDAQEGTVGCVASNNTTILSYCFTSATNLSAYYTTNGTTWTAGSVTGIPTFAAASAACRAWASSSGEGNTYLRTGARGICFGDRGAAGQHTFTVLWCGARFLLIGPAATNYVCSLSTDGLAFGGDNTTAVIGGTAQARTTPIAFYRNGNNCYLNVGTAYRYSTDGGITWAAGTFAAAPNAGYAFYKFNKTDPTKIIATLISSSAAYYSADSGATWSASRPFPTDPTNGIAYNGNTVVMSDNSTMYVSTDNGTTWSNTNFPIGTLGTSTWVFSDAYRFYAGINSKSQILTSADGVTWTISNLPVNFQLGSNSYGNGFGIVSFDSNTVMLAGSYGSTTRQWSSVDGGITWTYSLPNYLNASYGGEPMIGDAYVTPDGGGFGFGTGRVNASDNLLISKADTTAGGAYYRTGGTAITPVRTNAFSYVRVG